MRLPGLALTASLAVLVLAGFSSPEPGSAKVGDEYAVSGAAGEEQAFSVRDDDGWTIFDYTDDLSDGETHTYSGRSVGDACVYSGERTVAGEVDRVSVERELAHHTGDCLMVTERGFASGSDDGREVPGGQEASEEAQPVVRAPRSGSVGVLASSAAWHRTRHLDPPGLTVTRTKTNVDWNYNGGCVTSSSGHTANHYWLAATGWSKTSSSVSGSRTCAGAYTTSYSFFRNGTFCVGQPATITRYAPNRIRGNADGSYTVSWTTTKSGGCNSWLSFQSHAGLG